MGDDMQIDGAGRRESIGTLTGWQLLAQSVQPGDADTLSSGGRAPGSDQQHVHSKPASSRAKHMRSLSNLSRTSSMSDDSGLGPAAASVTPRPHQWLYKEYKIQDEIGSGGFGRVCRARRLTDGKVVVVKEIKTTSLSAKQKAATMDEVQVLANFNHPNIVKYHDCFMDDVYINIVMEYCNAGDLAGLVKRRAGQLMPEHEIMSLFVQICLALHYVHAAGVLHRDLKTSNVLITSNPNFGGMPLLKLGDFGVAKINSAESSMASTIVGTPQYLSPEMCDNKPYGKKSDIWALGCILYELCTLQKAFDLGHGGISGIILKIMRGVYAPIPASYSDDMKTLVGSMLTTDPARRPNVGDILNMPFVKQHLSSYIDWARNVPDAHPEILSASLGDGYRGQRGSKTGQGYAPNLARISPMRGYSSTGSGGSTGSQRQQLQQQASGAVVSPTAAGVSAESAAAAAAVAGLSARSKHGSGGSSSHGSMSVAEGSAASSGTASVSAAAAAAATGPAPSQRSGAVTPSPQQQQQHPMPDLATRSVPAGAPAGPAELPAKTVAGWTTSIQPKQSISSRDQHMGGSNSGSGSSLPPAGLQHPPGGSAGSNNSTFSTFPSQSGGTWAQQSGPDAATTSAKPGLTQEQMEGLRRLRGLKARLQVSNCWDTVGTAVRLGSTGWRGRPSADSDVQHML